MAVGAFTSTKKKTSPVASPARSGDPVASLKAMVSKGSIGAGEPQKATAKQPTKPTDFVPGTPGKAKSGKTAAQILKDPVTLKKLAEHIESWEAENSGKKLKGPAVKGMLAQILPDVSDAQARTIARQLNRMLIKATAKPNHIGRAAAKAMRRA